MNKQKYALLSLLILFLIIQLVPVNRDNPEFDVEFELAAPKEETIEEIEEGEMPLPP